MNICSAREYTMFGSAQFWRNWYEQRPSNKGDLGSGATGEVLRVYDTGGRGGPACDLIFYPVVRDCCLVAL